MINLEIRTMKIPKYHTKFRISVVLFLWISVSACGYQFTGGGNLPAGVNSMCITMLKNRTGEIGIETIFTNDIIREFTRNSSVALTSRERADAVLSGVIRSLRIETVSRSGQNISLEDRVKLAADLKLTDQEGNIIWSVKDLSGNEAYNVTDNKLSTEHNRHDAISEISKKLAESVYYRLTGNF